MAGERNECPGSRASTAIGKQRMGNRSYLKFSTGHIGKNGDIDGIVKTYEYNNGLAIIWMMLFDQADIIEIGFDCNNALTKNFLYLRQIKGLLLIRLKKVKK